MTTQIGSRFGRKVVFVSTLVLIPLVVALAAKGILWVSDRLLPILLRASSIAILICVFIVLPLSLFRKTRVLAGGCFVYASLLFGVFVWVYSCLIVADLWGYPGLIVGLLLAGVGVLPLALIASAIHGEWPWVLNIVLGLVLTFGVRVLGFWAHHTEGVPQ